MTSGQRAESPADGRLAVVLCWHMHQPEYRHPVTGEFTLPWVYLHGTKDYVDMAAHLEAVPGARAVVNFAPVLIEQIEAYVAALEALRTRGTVLPDRLLGTLAPGGLAVDDGEARRLVSACLRANAEQLIDPYPRFAQLAARARLALDSEGPLPAELLGQISVWYHLAWLSEAARRDDARVAQLLAHDGEFDDTHRGLLLEVIATELATILPRYRRLAERGQVELSVTPWGHPILPLLLDVGSAREQMPDAPLPTDAAYPGGQARAGWHIAHAQATFARVFGRPAAGCWPAEGAVGESTVALLADAGFAWLASGGTVLRASLAKSGLTTGGNDTAHRAWRLGGSGPACFFRDDELSDRIGFTYSRWHGDDAAANLVNDLDALAGRFAGQADHVVTIILDGENAWEYYPYNGYYFLNNIYRALSDHPRLRLTTFSELLASGMRCESLPRLATGSWVHGTLATWIGTAAKNRAFELLCEAKRAFDGVMAAGTLDAAHILAARRQLGVCEGSDWAWWFADFNAAQVVAAFDGLYRQHLQSLYALLGLPPPASLSHPFATGRGGAEQGGTMQRAEVGGRHA